MFYGTNKLLHNPLSLLASFMRQKKERVVSTGSDEVVSANNMLLYNHHYSLAGPHTKGVVVYVLDEEFFLAFSEIC